MLSVLTAHRFLCKWGWERILEISNKCKSLIHPLKVKTFPAQHALLKAPVIELLLPSFGALPQSSPPPRSACERCCSKPTSASADSRSPLVEITSPQAMPLAGSTVDHQVVAVFISRIFGFQREVLKVKLERDVLVYATAYRSTFASLEPYKWLLARIRQLLTRGSHGSLLVCTRRICWRRRKVVATRK